MQDLACQSWLIAVCKQTHHACAQEEEAAESAAQDAVTAELQRRAAAKAAWQSAARRSALEWLRSPVTEAAARAVADWQATLQVSPRA